MKCWATCRRSSRGCRETVRLDEVGRSVAQGEVARPGKAVVVVHLYRSGVQHLADSEVTGGGVLKAASHAPIRPRKQLGSPLLPHFPLDSNLLESVRPAA